MDRPSSSRVRPTASNRWSHHRMEEVVEELNPSEVSEGDVVEEEAEMEMRSGP